MWVLVAWMPLIMELLEELHRALQGHTKLISCGFISSPMVDDGTVDPTGVDITKTFRPRGTIETSL